MGNKQINKARMKNEIESRENGKIIYLEMYENEYEMN